MGGRCRWRYKDCVQQRRSSCLSDGCTTTHFEAYRCDSVDAVRKDAYKISVFLATSVPTLLKYYGHHNPDHQNEIADAIGQRPENVRIIGVSNRQN
jgi:hypothetical protein